MKQLFIFLSIIQSLSSWSQSNQDKGISFTQRLSWSQIKEKAKKENKYIFIDCYTTWCGPCKVVEKNVFTKDFVGQKINSQFISVRVQMDSLSTDSKEVQAWYRDAANIAQIYEVNTFPTFLFFDPYGRIVHRSSGATADTFFVTTAQNALDSNRQYYSLVNKYLRGCKEYHTMPSLISMIREAGDLPLSQTIVRDYISYYLNINPAEKLLHKDYANFTVENRFILNSGDSLFRFIYRSPDVINHTLGSPMIAGIILRTVIQQEEINPLLQKASSNKPPVWEGMHKIILQKYNRSFADQLTLEAKIQWYTQNKNWPKIVQYSIEKIEQYGMDTAGIGKYFLNNLIFEVIFKHGQKPQDINKGIKWIEEIIATTPDNAQLLDTYANLLYKAGRRTEAISFQKKAIHIDEKNAQKVQQDPDLSLKETLHKMKRNEPTWNASK